MRFIPEAVRRTIADQALLGKKHSPTILLGAGITSMVGSTVLACRATLKVGDVLDEIEVDKQKTVTAKEYVESRKAAAKAETTSDTPPTITYTDSEVRRDLSIIYTRGAVKVVKLYAPAVILGGIGVVCLTKSHQILKERNLALTAAYLAVDKAFQTYRERVIDRYGEETDRELRYDSEVVDVIDDETGKLVSMDKVVVGDQGMYARWFDEENLNWSAPPMEEYNWLFLANQQRWANDVLRSRGHIFLNEVLGMLGIPHTSAGSIVGWVYDRDNEKGDNYVDFGCLDLQTSKPIEFFNGREGAILLDFNVDGPIWHLIDERRERKS